MTEIGIVDTRNIIKLILEKYGYDFSDFALTSFKRRLEYILQLRNLKHPEIMLNRLEDPVFFEQFLEDICVPSTEMFRDPSLWRLLRDRFLPELIGKNQKLKIWLPGTVSCDELYSLCIILREMEVLEQTDILATCFSAKSIDSIKSGFLRSSKVEVSEENYERINGKGKFRDYCTTGNGIFYRDTSLLKNVTFDLRKIDLDNPPHGIKLILYRNRMIYFNATLQGKVLKNIHTALVPGGFLITGIKELLSNLHHIPDFILADAQESIYKRK
jgi:chemotaxis protein methyltransferase CheR